MKRATLGLVLLVAGCSEERAQLESLEKQVKEAEQQLTSLRAQKESLETRRKGLVGQLPDAEKELALARQSEARTRAAYALLLTGMKPRAVLSDDDERAMLGFQMGIAAKDLKSFGSFVAPSIAGAIGCESEQKEDSEGDEGGGCVSNPVVDACEGVGETEAISPSWTCQVVKHGKDVPNTAFCTSHVAFPDDAVVAIDSLPTTTTLIRTATVLDGKAVVSDYPSPSFDLFNPPNTAARTECAAETSQNECVHNCDVQYDRYTDPCSTEDVYDDCGCGDGYEGEGGEEEDPAVAAARREAAEAEERAAAAEREAEAARQEVRYQECLSGCRPSPSSEEEFHAPEEKASVEEELTLAESPAPGAYLLHVTRRYRNHAGAIIDVGTATRLLSDQYLSDGKKTVEAEDGEDQDALKLESLLLLGDADDDRYESLRSTIEVGDAGHEMPGMHLLFTMFEHPRRGRIWVQPWDSPSGLIGYTLNKSGEGIPVDVIDGAELCGDLASLPEKERDVFKTACEVAAKKAQEKTAAPVAAAAVVDGGTP